MSLLRFSTRQKIALARMASFGVGLARAAVAKPMHGTFVRRGIKWELDLKEGIDFAIFLFGAFEPELISYYNKHIDAGSVVLDLGANVGAHTLPLARQVGANGQVIAVEATEYAFEKLQRNLSANPDVKSRVSALHALLASSMEAERPAALHSSWPLTAAPTAHPTLGGTLKTVGQAAVVTVDHVVETRRLPRVDWIKLDVDGHELAVLQGANGVLSSHAPRILMELAPYCHADTPGQFAALLELLWQHGYEFFDLRQMAKLPKQVEKVESMIPKNGSINVLATTQPIGAST